MKLGQTLYVSDAAQWRQWLRSNCSSASEIWLIYYTKASGKPSIPYGDAVDEALCFGWIDSVVKKHGPQSRVQRFTPRRPGSKLSEANKVRVRNMVAQGRMTPAGLAAAGDVLKEPFVIPDDIVAALKDDPEVWRKFQAFPESYQCIRVGFVDGARKRPDVFKQRLGYLVKMTKQNKRYGIFQG